MERKNGKEKSEEEPWTGRRILGVAAAGAVAVAGAFFLLSMIGDSAGRDQTAAEDDDDPPARLPGRTMKGPGTGGESISRDRFEADAKTFFKTGRQKGTAAAVDAFK